MSSEITRQRQDVGMLILSVEKQLVALAATNDYSTMSIRATLAAILVICRENHLRNAELEERVGKVIEAARLRTLN